MARRFTDHGYMTHPDDVDGTCFYCGLSDVVEFDYVPSRDVAKSDTLRAAVEVPFHSVSACHKCKVHVYHHRYTLLTAESRRSFISKKLDKKSAKDEANVLNLLKSASLKPWETATYTEGGERIVSDIPDIMLTQEVIEARRKFYADRNPVAQPTAPDAPRTEDEQKSGPKDAPGTIKLDF